MNNEKGWLEKLVDKTALNWLPIILVDSKFKKFSRPTSKRRREIKAKIDEIEGDVLQVLITQFEKLNTEDDKRRVEIDSKASTLIRFTGVVIGVVVGFSPFLLGIISLDQPFQITITILYLFVGVFLIFTIILAQRAVEIGKGVYMTPNPSDILGLRDWNKETIYRQLAADLLISYENNLAVINDKAAYTRGAQDWFRNSIVFLFVLMCMLALGPRSNIQNPSEPLPVIILTSTPEPTSTGIPTPTIPLTRPVLTISPTNFPIGTQAVPNQPTSSPTILNAGTITP